MERSLGKKKCLENLWNSAKPNKFELEFVAVNNTTRGGGEWKLLDGSEWFSVLMQKFIWLFGEKVVVLYKDFISARKKELEQNPTNSESLKKEIHGIEDAGGSYFKKIALTSAGVGATTGTGVFMSGVTTTFVAGASSITSTGSVAFVGSTLPGLVCIGPVGWGIIAGVSVCVGVAAVAGSGYALYRWWNKKQ